MESMFVDLINLLPDIERFRGVLICWDMDKPVFLWYVGERLVKGDLERLCSFLNNKLKKEFGGDKVGEIQEQD